MCGARKGRQGVCSRLRRHGHSYVWDAPAAEALDLFGSKEDACSRGEPAKGFDRSRYEDGSGAFGKDNCMLCGVLNRANHPHKQFIDLCILLGCDYMDPIKGMGPKTALKLLREHETIEGVLEHIKDSGKKMVVPDVWPYQEAREIFRKPDVAKGEELEVRSV